MSRQSESWRCSLGGLAGNGEEEFELGRQLVFGVESVGEVDSSDTAVGVDLNSRKTNVQVNYLSELRSYTLKIKASEYRDTYLRVSM